MANMDDSHALLRRRIAALERGRVAAAPAVVPTGHAEIDRALGGGLSRGHVHELFAREADDAGCGAGFAGVLAQRIGGELLWLREEATGRRMGHLHAPGLAEIGVDPAKLTLGILADAAAVLRAAADGMRCPDLGVVVIELWGSPRQLDLTASRRLALAAENSGVTALLLRVAAAPEPSAALTRWQVAAAASAPLPANAPGHPAWEIELLRQRGRPPGGRWRVEWDRERGELADRSEHGGKTVPGAMVPLSAYGPVPGDLAGLRRAG